MAAPGLGHAHQQDRKRKLATLRHDGWGICWRCHQIIHPWQELDLDHVTARALGGGALTVLTHRRCNRSAGATLGNRLRRTRPRRPRRRTQPPSRW